MSQGKVCLRCGHQEREPSHTRCTDCGGFLWVPQNVGGRVGNTDMGEASRLIRAGKTPWRKQD